MLYIMANHPTVDLVIPVYNEAEGLQDFHNLLCKSIDPLQYRFHILYVNDGSTDSTSELLADLCQHDGRVQVIELSRNFGHQAALTAGMDQAHGDYVITLDGDGQHPPGMICEMLNMAQHGYEVVLTQRVQDEKSSPFKRFTSSLFYNLINRMGDTHIEPGAADFRLLSRPVVDSLCQMREYHRFLRGMLAWMGFKTVILPYRAEERLGGKSKYTLRKMTRLAMNAIFSFSLIPLYISISLGFLMLLGAVLEVLYVLSLWLTGNQATLAPGWSSLMFMMMLIGGILMILLGFIGIYVGYIFQEVKRRPIYLIRKISPQEDPGHSEN